MLIFSLLTVASAGPFGVWYGEVTEDWKTCGSSPTNNPAEVEYDKTIQALSDLDAGRPYVEVDLEAADPLEELLAYDAAAAGTSVEVVGRIDVWRNTDLTRSEWEDALAETLDDLDTHLAAGGSQIVALTVHELHKDLCSPSYKYSEVCWTPSDVDDLTADIKALSLTHDVYIPADHRLLYHLEDSVILGDLDDTLPSGTGRWTRGSSWAMSWEVFPAPFGRPDTLTFTWANITSQGRFDLSLYFEDTSGTETEIWTSGDLNNVLQRVHQEELSLPAVREGTYHLRVTTLNSQVQNPAVAIHGATLTRPSILSSRFSRVLPDTGVITHVDASSGTSSPIAPPPMSSDWDAVLNTPPSVLSVLAGSDADDDGVIAADPSAVAEAFAWLDDVLPATTERYAMVRAVDSNNETASGWYRWQAGDFATATEALFDAGVDGVVLYKAPIALHFPEEGQFSEAYRRDEGLFKTCFASGVTDLDGHYQGLHAPKTSEEITRLFVRHTEHNADAYTAYVTILQPSPLLQSSLLTPFSGTVTPADEVAALATIDEANDSDFVEIDLSSLGGSIPVGSDVLFFTYIEGNPGRGYGAFTDFLPVCSGAPCDLAGSDWMFLSDIVVDDNYVQDIYKTMLP